MVFNCRGANVANNFIVGSRGIGLTLGGNLELSYSGNKFSRNNVGLSYQGNNTVLYDNNYFIGNAIDVNGSASVLSGRLQYFGTLDGSGNASAVHNLGVPNLGHVRSLRAYAKSQYDVVEVLTIGGMDGTNLYVSGGAGLANRPYIVEIELQTRAWA